VVLPYHAKCTEWCKPYDHKSYDLHLESIKSQGMYRNTDLSSCQTEVTVEHTPKFEATLEPRHAILSFHIIINIYPSVCELAAVSKPFEIFFKKFGIKISHQNCLTIPKFSHIEPC
jgi:hypothetical protein